MVLTDFGIAQSEGDSRITQANVVMGSAGYTAPERFSGQDATPASDLWSLGATLYAAVEGHGPYQRDSMSSMLAATVFAAPPPAPSAGRLAPLIDALLRRDPATRPSAVVAARAYWPRSCGGCPTRPPPHRWWRPTGLDLTPADSALREIAEPTERDEPQRYHPPPAHERTQTSPIPPLRSGRRVRVPGSARRAGSSVRVAVAIVVIAGIGVGGFFLLKSRLIQDSMSKSAATRSLPPTTPATGSPSSSTSRTAGNARSGRG